MQVLLASMGTWQLKQTWNDIYDTDVGEYNASINNHAGKLNIYVCRCDNELSHNWIPQTTSPARLCHKVGTLWFHFCIEHWKKMIIHSRSKVVCYIQYYRYQCWRCEESRRIYKILYHHACISYLIISVLCLHPRPMADYARQVVLALFTTQEGMLLGWMELCGTLLFHDIES